MIKRYKKDIKDEIFWNYFKYQNLSFLAKDLIIVNQAKNEKIMLIMDWLTQETPLIEKKIHIIKIQIK